MAATTSPLAAALAHVLIGGALLKAGRSGKPHFRQFTVSPDLTKLSWASPKKAGGSGKILFKNVEELRLGQNTKVFSSNRMVEHEHVSFSLITKSRTLDVICKDVTEFNLWTTALGAIVDGTITPDSEEFIEAQMVAAAAAAGTHGSASITVEVRGKSTVVQRREDASDLYTFGHGASGRLGHGDEDDRMVPQVVEALLGTDVRAFSAANAHMGALSPNGQLYMWGRGGSGRLGQGHERDRVTPLMVGAVRDKKIVALATGDTHSLALDSANTVYSWGSGRDGRLGYDCAKQRVPSPVPGLDDVNVTTVLCGASCSAIITTSGILYTWGANDHGQLGHGDLAPVSAPKRVDSLADSGIVITVADFGVNHAAAVSADGSLYTWGSGESGKLGLASEDDALVPTHVESLSGVTAVAVGAMHTIVLTEQGTIYAFGSNRLGQLGIGTKASIMEAKPIKIALPDGVIIRHISSGLDHIAAVTTDDKVLTWGLGLGGRLGHGSDTNALSPTFVDLLNDKVVRTVECGGAHTAATVVHGWVDDDETHQCMACKASFTFVRRRHHCRRCGGLYCGSCSSHKFPLLSLGFSEAVRVCDKCFTVVSQKQS